jgi:hypothetical protein
MSTTAATIIPIVIAAQQEEMLAYFRETGATSRRSAIAYAPEDIMAKDLFGDLVRQRVLVRTRGGLYYLDERRLKAHEGEQARIALLVLGILILAGLIVLAVVAL